MNYNSHLIIPPLQNHGDTKTGIQERKNEESDDKPEQDGWTIWKSIVLIVWRPFGLMLTCFKSNKCICMS